MRPTSAPSKHMVLITPKQGSAEASKPGKPKKQASLKPIKQTTSTGIGGTPVVPDINSEEKQKLKLLAGNPMKLEELHATLREKERKFEEEAKRKEEKLQRLQQSIQDIIEKKTDEGTPLVDFSSVSRQEDDSGDELDLSQSSALLESIESGVSTRSAARERLQAATDELLSREDEDGFKLIELPAKYEDILEMVYEMQSADRDNVASNCIEVYEKREAIISQNEKNQQEWEKIRELDRIIARKEKELKEIEGNPTLVSGMSTDRPTFVTHYKKPASVTSAKVQDKVQKNIELASNPAARFSMIERLPKKEKDRLAELEEEKDPKPVLYSTEMQKLAAIDEKLKAFVPQEKWEQRSIQSYPLPMLTNTASDTSFNTTRSALTAPSMLMTEAQPGDKELSELRERREARKRLDDINKSLTELAEKPIVPLSDFEVRKLLSQADDAILDSQEFIIRALVEEKTSALETAKELLAKLEGNMQEEDNSEEILRQAEIAMQKYENLYALEQEALHEDPQQKAQIRDLMEKYEAKEREIDDILRNLDDLEAKTKQELEELEGEERVELPEVTVPEEPIDDFEKAIEKRVRARDYHQTTRSVLTAEDFPLTLQLLGARPPSPDS